VSLSHVRHRSPFRGRLGLKEASEVRGWKNWVGVVTLTSALLLAGAAPVIANDEPSLVRVRTLDALVGSLIQEGAEYSAAFRRLIARIDHTDGIVYILVGTCPGRVHACFLHSVSLAGPNRVLRIVVNTQRKPRDVIASIAHELSHAMEVLSEPGIRDDLAIFNFYNRPGGRRGETFETAEAIATEIEVRSEVGGDFNKIVAR
jgi:hypothetical protein